MAKATQKREAAVLDATPSKRLFWSIVTDYDTSTALCELVDNAIDLWGAGGQKKLLTVDLVLDSQRQLIVVTDNAGGVATEDLRLLVTPGGSNNDPSAATIGIFGVGSKRAVVALADTVSIKTRRGSGETFEIDITNDWLESADWEIPAYRIPEIRPGTTEVRLTALRRPIASDDFSRLAGEFGEIYAAFLNSKRLTIRFNGSAIVGRHFEHWAFPPGFEPRKSEIQVSLEGGKVIATIAAGLITDRDPTSDNYGVYFYCNQRLVAKELKVREVGYFVTTDAGVPHPDASLCRVIVKLEGPAKLMPWNSSKTGINFGHPVFGAIRPTIIPLVSYFSSLSRRLKEDWDTRVFTHTHGEMKTAEPVSSDSRRRLALPPLPKVNKTAIEQLVARNKKSIKASPWTLGLVEAIAGVDIISRQRLQTKNRISLILLDSSFEIALKEFVVHRTDLFPTAQYGDNVIRELFSRRDKVIADVSKKVPISALLLDRAKHYYGIRNKLIHERATAEVTDADIESYRSTVSELLRILFGLRV